MVVYEIVVIGTDPQYLVARPGLNVMKRRQHTALKDIKPGGDVKAGNVNGEAKIVPGSEQTRGWMGDNLVKIGLPRRKVRITGKRQPHPVQ